MVARRRVPHVDAVVRAADGSHSIPPFAVVLALASQGVVRCHASLSLVSRCRKPPASASESRATPQLFERGVTPRLRLSCSILRGVPAVLTRAFEHAALTLSCSVLLSSEPLVESVSKEADVGEDQAGGRAGGGSRGGARTPRAVAAARRGARARARGRECRSGSDSHGDMRFDVLVLSMVSPFVLCIFRVFRMGGGLHSRAVTRKGGGPHPVVLRLADAGGGGSRRGVRASHNIDNDDDNDERERERDEGDQDNDARAARGRDGGEGARRGGELSQSKHHPCQPTCPWTAML